MCTGLSHFKWTQIVATVFCTFVNIRFKMYDLNTFFQIGHVNQTCVSFSIPQIQKWGWTNSMTKALTPVMVRVMLIVQLSCGLGPVYLTLALQPLTSDSFPLAGWAEARHEARHHPALLHQGAGSQVREPQAQPRPDGEPDHGGEVGGTFGKPAPGSGGGLGTVVSVCAFTDNKIVFTVMLDLYLFSRLHFPNDLLVGHLHLQYSMFFEDLNACYSHLVIYI